MGVKEKDKSLLEIAVELLLTKHKPQPIMQIAKEAMEIKGLKTAQAKEILPQFLLDFQASGYFVYCGDGCWDIKDRQPTSVLDKDGTDLEIYSEEDDDISSLLKEDGELTAEEGVETGYEEYEGEDDEDSDEY